MDMGNIIDLNDMDKYMAINCYLHQSEYRPRMGKKIQLQKSYSEILIRVYNSFSTKYALFFK